MDRITMPAALLARRLRSSLWCQKQVVIGHRGRSAMKTMRFFLITIFALGTGIIVASDTPDTRVDSVVLEIATRAPDFLPQVQSHQFTFHAQPVRTDIVYTEDTLPVEYRLTLHQIGSIPYRIMAVQGFNGPRSPTYHPRMIDLILYTPPENAGLYPK
jgi:hypothetical protein